MTPVCRSQPLNFDTNLVVSNQSGKLRKIERIDVPVHRAYRHLGANRQNQPRRDHRQQIKDFQ